MERVERERRSWPSETRSDCCGQNDITVMKGQYWGKYGQYFQDRIQAGKRKENNEPSRTC